jgi:hypothetical protein
MSVAAKHNNGSWSRYTGLNVLMAGKCMHVVKHMWLDVCMYVCAPHVIYGTVFLFLLGFW